MSITDDEIAVLNAARTVLDKQARAPIETAQEGRVSAAAAITEHAIFTFLNWTHSYLHVEMSKEQLHNRAPEEVTA